MASRFPRLQLSAAVLIASFLAVGEARAQCPDGTPPPCAGARRAPALNARRYVVVPFGNVTRAQDLDWLRDASVNLLTLEIGRWNDVEVVNDKRVGDLLRETGIGTRGAALTLNDGLAIARRAGAGKLVMGDFLKVGSTTRLVANVFDARTGSRVRSVQQQTTVPDSLLNVFGPLARGVLDVPQPGEGMGEIGTTHLDAYQAYLAGVRALNRFDVATAHDSLARALQLDSTFALAHYQMSVVLGWGEASFVDGPETRAHALAAQRFAAGLPPRERALIAGQVALAASDYDAACGAFAPLVARDSSDVLALYNLGECAYHDRTLIVNPRDTTLATLKWGWNLALRSLERALQLDPAVHQAYEHILDILGSPAVFACRPPVPNGPCPERFEAAVLRDHDTLVTRLAMLDVNDAEWYRQRDSSYRQQPVLANLALAQRILTPWVASDSLNLRAQMFMARVLLAQGDVAGADRALRHVANVPAYAGNLQPIRLHLEIALKLGRGAEARAWFDSLVKMIPDAPNVLATRGALELPFGRLDRIRRGIAAGYQRWGPAAVAYSRHMPLAVLGVRDTGLAAAEAAFIRAMPDTATCNAACRLPRLAASLLYAPRVPRAQWPAFPAELDDYRYAIAAGLARRDTAAVRQSALDHDSLVRRNVGAGWFGNGWGELAVEGYLAVGDSARALRMARWVLDTAMASTPLVTTSIAWFLNADLWPRTMMIRADLAAALGYRDEAKLWYDRVIDLWADADPELQPELARLRQARAQLGP